MEVKMPWILLIFAAVFAVSLFFCKKGKHECDGIAMLTGVLGAVLLVAFIAWPVSYAATTGRIADLEAFQESVFEAYVSTVDATDKAVVKLDLEKLLVSAENIKQSTNLSDRIAELRDRVVWYNETLKRLRAMNKIGWLDAFIKDVPDSLQMIKLSAGDFGIKNK